MPRLSQDMETGQVVEWLKAEGDVVTEGEPILVVETDKANMDVESPASGVLRRILAHVGEDADVGSVLAIIAGADEELPPDGWVAASDEGAPPPAPAPAGLAGRVGAPGAGGPSKGLAGRGARRPSSPAARRVAAELGVDIARLDGSGEGGLITEADVRAAVQGGGEPPVSGEGVTEVPLIGTRRRIAERMALSRRTVADVTTVIDVDMSAVAALRESSQLPYTAYVAFAVARSLTAFPALNATLRDDRLFRHRDVHLGVAVARDDGLVVPVIREADRLSLSELAAAIDRLATAARADRIEPDMLTGSTFTLTNSGTFGSLFFTPIVNVPEVAILGMGRVADAPVVRDGAVVAGKVMYLSLSYDHRVVDGAEAVSFVADVKRRLESMSAGEG
jgi:pyruvate/2-oxoglutarate dehydrogenase complex dihydrolipoamide acyltransferase (E2) component